jgi:hypothetical protein
LRKSGLKVTGESIVREFRQNQTRRPNPNINPPKYNVVSEGYNPSAPPLKLRGGKVGLRIPWYRGINWDVALEWVCWAAVVTCLIYIGIFVIVPFGMKLIWK